MTAPFDAWWGERRGRDLLAGEAEEAPPGGAPLALPRARPRLAIAAAAAGALLLAGAAAAVAASARRPEAAQLGRPGLAPDLEAIVATYDALPGSLFERASALPEPPALRGLGDSAAGASVDAWRVTDCVIDIDQATGFLMFATVTMYYVVENADTKCPENEAVCAQMLAGFVGSLAIFTTFISLAVSSCPAYMPANSAALCSSDWSALVSMFSFMVFAGAGMSNDCNFQNTTVNSQNTTLDHILGMVNDASVGLKEKYEAKHGKTAASSLADLAGQVESLKAKYLDAKQKYAGGLKNFYAAAEAARDSKRAQQRARQFSQLACAADVMESLGYSIRAITQLRAAAVACPDPKLCAIDITSMVGSINFVATFVAFAVNDCPLHQDAIVAKNAACSSEITLMVGTTVTAAAVGTATTVDCVDQGAGK